MGDEAFMALAIEEARRAGGRTSPNPPVGAVLVREGKVVGRGHTSPPGGPHAEVVALAEAGDLARGATLYATLEPCSHHGRTGPCTQAILGAGVSRVVVGARDVNPRVQGRGVDKLRRGGAEVEVGVLQEECEGLNRPFFTWVRRKRPYVVLKAAATLDGRIATRTGHARWVSGPESRALSHRWRDGFDAILVGAGTVAADDPRLTTRLPDGGGRDPIRVVLDGRLSTDPGARIYRQRSEAPTWLVVPEGTRERRLEPYRHRGRTEILKVSGRRGRVEVKALLRELARREVVTLLVEGGAEVHGAFLASGQVDELRLFLSPKIVGEGPSWLQLARGTGPARMSQAWDARRMTLERVGEDLLLTALLRR